jgi:hypothetical protein
MFLSLFLGGLWFCLGGSCVELFYDFDELKLENLTTLWSEELVIGMLHFGVIKLVQ